MGFLKHSVLAQNIVATFIETCREPDYYTNNFVTSCKNNSKLTHTSFLVFHLKKLRAISEQTCLLRKYRFGTQLQFYVVYILTCIVNTQFQISKNDQFSHWIWIYRRTSVKCLHSLISIINAAVTRIRTWVTSATTKGTNHYTITATGTDKSTISFLRSLFSAPYILVSTPSILYHKREVEVKWESYPNSTPESVCG